MTSSFNIKMSIALGTILAIGSIASPMTAWAGTFTPRFMSSAAGVCQAALPSGAGAVVRARPLAVQNEGTNAAFVTCSFPYDNYAAQPLLIGLMLSNSNSVNAYFACTLVSGITATDANYVVRNVAMLPNSTDVTLFDSSDLPNSPDSIPGPNVSCALPPGVGIVWVYYY